MVVMEKAKDLGREIRSTSEFKELEKANQGVQEDPDASRIINEINSIQQQISFSQNSGVEPEQAQIDKFNNLKQEMQTSMPILNLIKAQESFNTIMEDINGAISEGLGAE